MPRNERVYRALARDGLDVAYDGHGVYTVRPLNDKEAVTAEVLLPESLPLEAKALKQLADLASVRHPDGGHVCRVCATPDFHPGDSGIAIGSVVEYDGLIAPQAIGTDINCGMRLHVADLSIDKFLSRKQKFVELLKGDYLLGTRNVEMSSNSMHEMFRYGVPSWLEAVRQDPLGCMARADIPTMESEVDRILYRGELHGDIAWAPDGLAPTSGRVRDDGMATIGRGNHFVEVQIVEEVVDRQKAFEWGVRKGQISFMIHSGSRNVGRYIGGRWLDKARELWPKGTKHPESKIFPVSEKDPMFAEYIAAENTASNYAFVNRVLLAELLRIRLREVYGDVDAPLVYDLPHNYTVYENGKWVSRKGACPAHTGQPVIIPGSMGSSSYLLVGKGNERFIRSASHGAGRAISRFGMGRFVKNEKHMEELGLKGVECVTLREERRVEEAPNAYKPIGPIIESQVEAGMVGVVARMKPILTFKA